MKSILFTLSILATFSARCQTLPLDSFYSSGSSWVEYTNYVYGLGENKTEGRSYLVTGDTVMGGISYHLVSSKLLGGYGTQPTVSGTETYYFHDTTDFGTIGGVRVAGNQVFFHRLIADSGAFINTRGLLQDSDVLVYDYNVAVGDTVSWQTNNVSWGLYNVVRSIDSILLPGGFYVKRVIFDSGALGAPGQNYWIAAIGSSLGFFGSHSTNTSPGFFSTKSLCYAMAALSYKFPNMLPALLADSCFSDIPLLSVADRQTQQNTVDLFPDPVSGGMVYFSGAGLQRVERVLITGITGIGLHELIKPFQNGNRALTVPEQQGVYILQLVFSDNTTITKKIIKL